MRFAVMLPRVSAVAILGLVSATPAWAAEEDRGLLDDKFVVSLGTFFMNTKTTLSINGSTTTNETDVDLEEDLGLNAGDRFRLDANWLISGRHHLRAMYFNYGNNNERTLDRSLTIGDTTYPVNVTVQAGMDTTIFELAYEYAFLQRENWELLGTIGAHLVKFEFSISGNGTVNGQPVQGRTESSDVTAPLPVVGLRYIWRFADNFYFEAQGQYFGLEIDNVDGSLTDLRAGVNWMFTKHFGVGLGWNQFTTDVDVARDRFNGSLDWTYSGAQIYLTGAW